MALEFKAASMISKRDYQMGSSAEGPIKYSAQSPDTCIRRISRSAVPSTFWLAKVFAQMPDAALQSISGHLAPEPTCSLCNDNLVQLMLLVVVVAP